MSLTQSQVKIVRDSFERLRSISDTVAEIFYNRLFELDPSLKSLFHHEMGEQRSKLMDAIALVVENLEDLRTIEPVIRELALRHVSYGVESRNYETVGEALLWSFEKALTPNFTQETRGAWVAAYGRLSTLMKAASINSTAR